MEYTNYMYFGSHGFVFVLCPMYIFKYWFYLLLRYFFSVSAGAPENYWLDGTDILAEGEWRWMSREGNSRIIQGYT